MMLARFLSLICGAALIASGAPTTATAQTPASASSEVSRPLDPTEAALKKTLEARMKMPLDGVTKLPIANLYEIRAGDDVFYADSTGNYILIGGSLIDVRTRENLTRARVEALKQVGFKWSELPLDASVKIVKGTGKRRVAIFEDPNCGYCKKLEKSILEIGDVTIYVFLYPVLGPDSLVKSKQVWCSADRARAWNDWMQNGTPLAGDGSCSTPLDKTLVLGKKLKVDGTPTMFFPNSKRVEGAVEAAELERQLSAAG